MSKFIEETLGHSSGSPAAVSAGLMIGAILLGLVLYRIVFATLTKWTKSTEGKVDDKIIAQVRSPMRLVFPIGALTFALPMVKLEEPGLDRLIAQVHSTLLVLAATWLVLSALNVVALVLGSRYDLKSSDNLEARSVQTQIRTLKNVARFIIILFAIALILMSFDSVRKLGVSLLASAGAAGVIVGFAAQRSIATVVAGIQIALTQPIRLDDVVIVEGEWGWIEEITLTYVVVRIWDLRRLVVPITYFIERPFQNWTRSSADLLGTVSLFADYSVSVEEIRKELKRILDSSEDWDKKSWGLQVVNATDRTVEVRALMSAADSSKAWNLRCKVREELIGFVNERQPRALPRIRAEMERNAA